MNCRDICVYNQSKDCECVHIVVQICCCNECGINMQGFNPHIPFGNHLLEHIYIGTRGFYTFFIVYTIDEGVHKKWFSFQFIFRRGMFEKIRGLSS